MVSMYTGATRRDDSDDASASRSEAVGLTRPGCCPPRRPRRSCRTTAAPCRGELRRVALEAVDVVAADDDGEVRGEEEAAERGGERGDDHARDLPEVVEPRGAGVAAARLQAHVPHPEEAERREEDERRRARRHHV